MTHPSTVMTCHKLCARVSLFLTSAGRTKWESLQIGVLLVGVLVMRALLFQVQIRVHEFWKLPNDMQHEAGLEDFRACSGPPHGEWEQAWADLDVFLCTLW